LPKAVPPEKIGEYLGLRLQGHSNSQACSQLGFSTRTGTNHLKKIRAEARKRGVISVMKSYELDIDEMFKLGRDLKDNDIKVEQCTVGFAIASVLTSLGVQLSVFDSFVKDVFISALSQEIKNNELAVTLAEFTILRKERGLTFRQANEEYQELIENKHILDAKSASLEIQIKSLKQQLKEDLKQAKTTRRELRDFTETRNTLSKIDVPIDDYEKLVTLFQNVGDLGNDPKALVSFFSAHKDLSEQKKELSDKVETLTIEEAKLSESSKKLEGTVKEKKSFVDSLRLLEEQRLSPENTRVLTEAIAAIGIKYGLPSGEAIDRFCDEVKTHFYPLLSLGDEETRRRARVDSLNLQMKELQRDLEIQSEVYDSRNKWLDILKTLDHAGVLVKDLISWNLILEKQGMDPTELKNSIERMGSLKSIVESKSGEVRDLETRCAYLNKAHDQLGSSLKSLTSDTVMEVKRNLGRFKEILDDFDEQFLSEETGFNAETKRTLNAANKRVLEILTKTEASWDNKLNDLSTQLGNVVQEVEETRDLAYETGKEVGQYYTINSMSKLLRGDPIERKEAITSMKILSDCMQIWAQHNRESELSNKCYQVSSQLAGMM